MFTPFAFVKSTSAAPSVSYCLDLYPSASRAYSVRRLSSTYTGFCMKVRRVSDNQDIDVGFDGENLDTGSINTFIGSGTGKVITWYDQSGNGQDATATLSSAPIIRSGGTTETIGTRVAMDGSTCVMGFTVISNLQRYCSLVVGKRGASGDRLIGFSSDSTPNPLLAHWSDNNFYFQWEDYYVNSSATNTSAAHEVLIGSTTSATTAVIDRNGASISLASPVAFAVGTNCNQIMKYGGQNGTTKYQEVILWESEQNSSFAGIQSNINTYYSIY